MKVTKMHGAGNDFVLINNRKEKISDEDKGALAKRLCHRRLSLGGDGLIFLDEAQGTATFAMSFYNSDGSAGEMCGNGARCLARFAYEEGVADERMTMETAAGEVEAWRLSEAKYKVRMQLPSVYQEVTIDLPERVVQGIYIELGDPGVPHYCVELPELADISEAELTPLALALRHHPAFPKGVNVNFYKILSPTEILEKTYERGVEDFTLACGSGSVSVVYSLMRSNTLQKDASITLYVPGGELQTDILWDNGEAAEIFLTGPVVMVYSTTLLED